MKLLITELNLLKLKLKQVNHQRYLQYPLIVIMKKLKQIVGIKII